MVRFDTQYLRRALVLPSPQPNEVTVGTGIDVWYTIEDYEKGQKELLENDELKKEYVSIVIIFRKKFKIFVLFYCRE